MIDCRGKDCGREDCQTCRAIRAWYERLDSDAPPVQAAITAAVAQPGDHILVGFRTSLTAEVAAKMKHALRERFPDVMFTLIDQVSGIAVVRADRESPMPTGEDIMATFFDPKLMSPGS